MDYDSIIPKNYDRPLFNEILLCSWNDCWSKHDMTCFTFFILQLQLWPKAEVCQGQTFGCGRRWKWHLQSNTSVWLFGDSIKYTKVSENILMYIYYVFTTQCIFMFIDKKVNTYFQDILSVLHVRTINKGHKR